MNMRALFAIATVLLLAACGGTKTPAPQPDDAGPDADSGGDDCDCAPEQICGPLTDGGRGCLPSCEPGFEWTASECRSVPGMSCDPTAAMSIREQCEALHKMCEETETSAECGDCVADYVANGNACEPRETCPIDECRDLHRACDDSDIEAHAMCSECLASFTEVENRCVSDCPECTDDNRECGSGGSSCGACLDGFVEVRAGVCEEYVPCSAKDCGENQVCIENPNAMCAMQCDNDWVWDLDEERCRPELTCADLTCRAGQSCDERDDGQDAVCFGASCPEDEGRNTDDECEACSGWQNCTTMEGATGEVLATQQGCRCEPAENYFINASGAPQHCDTDLDGWINDQAAASIEGADQRLAACHLRSITSVVLINDAGEERTETLSPALPLYEHPTNDGSSSADPHPIYGVAIEPEALNSFTKACVTETGDFNRNGIDDVREHASAQVTVDNARVAAYFARYRSFAYFAELAEGWYSAPDEYTIRERPRITTSFPLRYPESASDKWQTCTRHVDSAYLAGGFATQAGRDFSGFSAQTGWGGMNHHSQFKCVRVVGSSSYLATAPEQVFVANTAIQWAGPGNTNGTPRNWYRNSCAGTDSYRNSPNAAVPNPTLQDFSCSYTESLTALEGHVMWVSIGYINGSQEGGASPTGPVYQRGCINECAEHDDLPASEQCEANTSNPGFGCRANGAAFGDLVCGCRRNFAGADCSIPCTDHELLTDIDAASFPDTVSGTGSDSVELRNGYWMCGGFSASSNYVLSGGGYTLRGEISATPIDGTVLSGGGYTLRAR